MDVPLAMLRYKLNVTRDPAEIRRLMAKIDAINRVSTSACSWHCITVSFTMLTRVCISQDSSANV